MLFRLRRDFVIGKLFGKVRMNIILLYEVFLTFPVEANQRYSTDNSKVTTFLHSIVFIAVVGFLLIWPLLNLVNIIMFQVWNLKTCPVCIKDERNKSQLFVHHMTPILKHLQSKEVTPIMWDDMMRWSPVEYLKGMLLCIACHCASTTFF